MLKKKIVASTIAVSLVLGSVSGLPLSSKGLAQKLGISHVANASAAQTQTLTEADKLKAWLNKTYTNLYPDAEIDELKAVRDARDKLRQLPVEQREQLTAPVWAAIDNAIQHDISLDSGNAAKYNKLNKHTISEILFAVAMLNYDNGNLFLEISNNDSYREVIRQLGVLGGIDGLSFADVNAFINAVEEEVAAKLQQLPQDILKNPSLILKPDEMMKSHIKQAIKDVLDDPIKDLKLSKAIRTLALKAFPGDLNRQQIKERIHQFIDQFSDKLDQIDPGKAASKSLAFAYARSHTELASNTVTDSKTLKPVLKVFGTEVPSALLDWSVKNNANITYENGEFKLSGNAASGQANVEAKFKLLDKIIFRGTVTFNSSTDPGVPPVVDPNIGEIISRIQHELKELKEKLKNATPEEAKLLIEQARISIQKAIKEIANIDLSITIIVEDGKAKPKIDIADLIRRIKKIKEDTRKLNDSLKELDPNAEEVKPMVRLNFGTNDAASTEVPLTKDLLKAAAAEGVDSVAVQVNGLALSLNPGEFTDDTTLTMTHLSDSVAKEATNLPLASKVYDFGLSVGGKAADKLSTPVVVEVPVANANQYDQELLALAKIENGKLQFHGGKVVEGSLVAKRKSFSTYVVVENKVSFMDGKDVSWASRFIEVAAAKGIIKGRGNNRFAPSASVTRAEFATMLVRTFGLEDNAATETFNDVNDGDWHKLFVASAVKSGVVSGRSAAIFDPNAEITRAEMATMAANALKVALKFKKAEDVQAALQKFKDSSSIASSLQEGVALAVQAGLMIGYNGMFDPNDKSTRAQAAAVIYRLFNLQ